MSDLGLEDLTPDGNRRRVSHKVGLSIRNQANGGDMVGPENIFVMRELKTFMFLILQRDI